MASIILAGILLVSTGALLTWPAPRRGGAIRGGAAIFLALQAVFLVVLLINQSIAESKWALLALLGASIIVVSLWVRAVVVRDERAHPRE